MGKRTYASLWITSSRAHENPQIEGYCPQGLYAKKRRRRRIPIGELRAKSGGAISVPIYAQSMTKRFGGASSTRTRYSGRAASRSLAISNSKAK